MRTVVTGAAGFVGSTVCDQLLDAGHEVIGVDCFIDYYPRELKELNLEKAKSYDNFKFVEADLSTADLQGVLEGAEWIFHLAAQAGVRASWGKDFSIYTQNNILATQRILECARGEAVRPNLQKVVYASSSSVYGHAETLPTVETLAPRPVSPYGVSKLAGEHLMVLYAHEFDVPTASLRYFTVYGPRQRPDMAFRKFITAGLNGTPIEVYGDGEQSRDFTYIADAAAATIAAASAPTSGLVCNIGGGSRVTLNEVISMIEKIMGSSLPVERTERQAGDARHTSADTSLAAKEIGYAPSVNLEQGLAKELEWLKSL